MKVTDHKKSMISRSEQIDFSRGEEKKVSGWKNEIIGNVNRGFENGGEDHKTYHSSQTRNSRSFHHEAAEKTKTKPAGKMAEITEFKAYHLPEPVNQHKDQSTYGYNQGREKASKQTSKLEQKPAKNPVLLVGNQNTANLRGKPRDGDIGKKISEMKERREDGIEVWKDKRLLQGNKSSFSFENDAEKEDTGNYRVANKCRQNPPINPLIIVTTEPFEKREKLKQIYEEKVNEAAAMEELEKADSDEGERGRKARFYRDSIEDHLAPMDYLSIANEKSNGLNKQTKVYDSKCNTMHANHQENSLNTLPITEINDSFDRAEVLYQESTGNPTRGTAGHTKETERKHKIHELATPILSINATQREDGPAKNFEATILKRQQGFDSYCLDGMDQPKLAKTGNEIVYGYRYAPQQISLSEAVKLLRKKRTMFANRKKLASKQSLVTRSTESSMKSTDADDIDSEISNGHEELRGVFKNLNEQHKMIERRSDAMINFRPGNRCDTRLVSTAYELASAMEHQKQPIKLESLMKANHSSLYHSNFDQNPLGLEGHVLYTSKPSTSTSYFNADGESLQSHENSNRKSPAPNWLYTVFAVLLWNSVVAIIHGTEGDQMTPCSVSIKWRLWCTMFACVVSDFLLELIYEKRGWVRAMLSSLMVFSVLLLANEHPLRCYTNGEKVKALNYTRASFGISLMVCLFVVWLKNGHFNAKRVPRKYHCRKERKLSGLPISDFESR